MSKKHFVREVQAIARLRDEKLQGAAEDRNFNQSPSTDVRLRLGYIVEVTVISEWDFSTRSLYSTGHGNYSTYTHVHWVEIGGFTRKAQYSYGSPQLLSWEINSQMSLLFVMVFLREYQEHHEYHK